MIFKNKQFSMALLLILVIFIPLSVSASDPEFQEEITAEEVKAAMNDAEKEYAEVLSQRTKQNPVNAPSTSLQVTSSDLEIKKNSTLEELAEQVDALKNRVIIERTSLMATQSPKKVRVQGGRTTFNYRDDAIYEITTSVDHVTDVALKEGENLTTAPTAGDTVRWNLSVMKSGQGSKAQTHLIIKPLDEDLETNLVITTDQNVYHIKLKSGDFHMPSVSWNYPQDLKLLMEASLRKENSQEATIRPDQLSFNYSIEGEDYNWKPVRVFDDGQKTFIQMPKNFRVTEAPVLFLLDDESNPMIVNYRVKGDLYILDRLIEHVELRVGVDKSITITLDDGRNFFERLFY